LFFVNARILLIIIIIIIVVLVVVLKFEFGFIPYLSEYPF